MSNASSRKAAPIEVVPEVETLDEDYSFEPIPMQPGDTLRIELTFPIPKNGQHLWVKVAPEIAALPGETAEDVLDRAQEIALSTLFSTADRFELIADERRKQQLADRTSNERN